MLPEMVRKLKLDSKTSASVHFKTEPVNRDALSNDRFLLRPSIAQGTSEAY